METVYMTPSFFKRDTEIKYVTESGIFAQGNGGCTKTYIIPDSMTAEERDGICRSLRQSDADYGFLVQKGKEKTSYLLIRHKDSEMTEAMQWFSEMEKQLRLKALALEQRMDAMVRFLADAAQEEYIADGYAADVSGWRKVFSQDKMKIERGSITAGGNIFSVMAVRRFPDTGFSGKTIHFMDKDYVEAFCMEAGCMDDGHAVQALSERYLGVEGVLPRIRRNNPQLYDCLRDNGEKNTRSFIRCTMYFLIKAPDAQTMDAQVGELIRCGKDAGMRLEQVPFDAAYGRREAWGALSMFAGSGRQWKRYSCILPSEAMGELFPEAAESAEWEDYDVEQLRELFCGGKGTGKNLWEKNP